MQKLTQLGEISFSGIKISRPPKAKGISQGSSNNKKKPIQNMNKIYVSEETSDKTNSIFK